MKMQHLAMSDEEQIRDLIQRWMTATKQGDVKTVLDLMTDDVVFMATGQAPFGKDSFRKSAEPKKTGTSGSRFEGETTIEELKVIGDWAYSRSLLRVATVSSNDSAPIHRAGYVLSIFRKEPDGKWRLARDANMLEIVE